MQRCTACNSEFDDNEVGCPFCPGFIDVEPEDGWIKSALYTVGGFFIFVLMMALHIAMFAVPLAIAIYLAFLMIRGCS